MRPLPLAELFVNAITNSRNMRLLVVCTFLFLTSDVACEASIIVDALYTFWAYAVEHEMSICIFATGGVAGAVYGNCFSIYR